VPKRVLMCLENAPYLLDSRVRPEATSLAAAGYEVSVICPGLITERPAQTVDGVHIYRYPVVMQGHGAIGYAIEYGYALVATFLLSVYVLMRRGFDVVHAHNPPDLFVLIGVLYKRLGKRFIYDQHDLAPEMYQALFQNKHPRIRQALIWFEKLSCRVADRIIVTNHSHERMILERSGIPQERITVVRNGPKVEVAEEVAPEQGLRRVGKVTLCYVGVMGAHDGVDLLLHSLRRLVDDLGRTDFHCVLVGAGGAWTKLKALSHELKLDDYVTFTGWIAPARVRHFISAADICVAPEPSNPYNDRCTVIKIAEYMALGKPVVAFDLPEHHVTAQAAALYATANDALDFARKVALLMDDPEQRQAMGQLGRQDVVTRLAWPIQLKHLLEVYHSLGVEDASPMGANWASYGMQSEEDKKLRAEQDPT
jgi:glycosyltransferase involved in cell wall biosynthesis